MRGGGIYCASSTAAISGNSITDNTAFGGAGVTCVDGAPVVSSNTITGNTAGAGHGGGLLCFGTGTATVTENVIASNTTTVAGGGLYCGVTMSVRGNIVAWNSATQYGGGIFCRDGAPTLSQNTISGNSASWGGGVLCWDSAAVIVNSVVVSSPSGSGIYLNAGSAPTVSYCDVYGNSGSNYAGMADQTGSNGNISEDPQFVNESGGDYHLKSTGGHWTAGGWVRDTTTSPCVDAGDPASDHSSEPIPNGGRINLGFEANTAQASKQANRTPAIPSSLAIAPDPADCTSVLQASASSSDPDDHAVTITYEWSKFVPAAPSKKDAGGNWGGWAYPSTDGILDGASLKRGDVWRVQARASDGAAESAWCAPVQVTIQNAAPRPPATLKIAPAQPLTTADLRPVFTAGSDADGDPLTYRFEWSRSTDNGANWSKWAWKTRFLGQDLTTRDEKWRVRACSADDETSGRWRISAAVTITNSRPTKPTSVRITPGSPAPTVDLTAEAIGSTDRDPKDEVNYEYEWRRSRGVGATWSAWGWSGQVLSNLETSPLDRWQVRGRATDGNRESSWFEGEIVTVRKATSSPPLLTAAAAQTRSQTVALSVTLSEAADVDVRVLNVAGRLVGSVPNCSLPSGQSTLLWSAASLTGAPVPTGTYLLHLSARIPGGGQTRSIVMLRLQR